ncbi:hypothetical protein JTB14_016961 [Gonioctena quinquepunctata]|nr:hypothetical protein JTB14_016961 [Gonioctena quinquepunctata]
MMLGRSIYQAVDYGDPALCIFLDLSKAFDTIDHVLLLEALEKMGIRETPHKLFSSYLCKRNKLYKFVKHIVVFCAEFFKARCWKQFC